MILWLSRFVLVLVGLVLFDLVLFDLVLFGLVLFDLVLFSEFFLEIATGGMGKRDAAEEGRGGVQFFTIFFTSEEGIITIKIMIIIKNHTKNMDDESK